MRNRPLFRASLALSVFLGVVVTAGREGQTAHAQAPARPLNRAPTLTLASGCGPSLPIGQTCTITVSAGDQDTNLARVDLNWNDGTPVESRTVAGGGANVPFSRSFSTPQAVRWSATAFDTTGVPSAQLSGTFSVIAETPVAPPSPGPKVDPSASAASEQQVAPFVVMIRGKLPNKSTVGAGVIFGIASDRLYIATANHVVRGERALGGEAPIAQELEVQLRWLRGEWQRAQVLVESFDDSLDLAVITVPGVSQLAVPKLPWASFVRSETLASGEQVAPMGYPGGMPWFMPKQLHVISNVTPQVLKTEGDLAPGYSGGALVTRDWGIAGIILNIGSVQNDILPIDLVLQRARNWGHEVEATFKERPRASGSAADASAVLARDRQDSEGLVGRWIAATLSRDVQAMLNMVEMPFYFDQEIVVRREDLERRLQELGARAADNLSAWKIQSIRAITVAELRARGAEANRDRVLGSLSMSDSDWQVVVIMAQSGSTRTEGTVFFVRKIGSVMKMVGLWG
jgi:S1-C subfamily serine protease